MTERPARTTEARPPRTAPVEPTRTTDAPPQRTTEAPPSKTRTTGVPPLLTTEEAAGHLGFEPETLEAWRSRRTGPAFIKMGKHVRYRLRDLIAYEDRMRIEHG